MAKQREERRDGREGERETETQFLHKVAESIKTEKLTWAGRLQPRFT